MKTHRKQKTHEYFAQTYKHAKVMNNSGLQNLKKNVLYIGTDKVLGMCSVNIDFSDNSVGS